MATDRNVIDLKGLKQALARVREEFPKKTSQLTNDSNYTSLTQAEYDKILARLNDA